MDCADAQLGVEAIERMKYVRMDDGTIAKRVVIVEEEGENLACGDDMSLSSLRLGSSVKVGENQWADRVVVVV